MSLFSPNQNSKLIPVSMKWLAIPEVEVVVVTAEEVGAVGADAVDSPAPMQLQWVVAAVGRLSEMTNNLRAIIDCCDTHSIRYHCGTLLDEEFGVLGAYLDGSHRAADLLLDLFHYQVCPPEINLQK